MGIVHFGSGSISLHDDLSRHQDRISFTKRPELGPLLADYRDRSSPGATTS